MTVPSLAGWEASTGPDGSPSSLAYMYTEDFTWTAPSSLDPGSLDELRPDLWIMGAVASA